MKLSREWLGEYTTIGAPDKEYCDAMTMSGSKVEGWEVTGSEISRVVVGRVLSMERHTNSDHMWVCKIDVGGERELQIVTGAQNVNIGDLVPVALDGSTLPGGKEIRTGKLRGELSEGMLCSLGELGLEQRDFPYAIEDGIFILEEDCVPGDDIREVCGLNDSVVEFEITNNRPDCLSVRGLARESACTFHTPLTFAEPTVTAGHGDIHEKLSVEIKDAELCPRYTARMVKISRSPRRRSGCAAVCARPACARSTTSSISRTTSCSSTASRCTRSTTPACTTARSSSAAPKRANLSGRSTATTTLSRPACSSLPTPRAPSRSRA